MSSYSRSALLQKLKRLSNSQSSIQTASQWIIFHWRNADDVVTAWESELRQSKVDRKMLLLYLANDVLQSRKKHRTDAVKAVFAKVLPRSLEHIIQSARSDQKIVKKASRVLSIWRDRHVFTPSILDRCFQAFPGDERACPMSLSSASQSHSRSARNSSHSASPSLPLKNKRGKNVKNETKVVSPKTKTKPTEDGTVKFNYTSLPRADLKPNDEKLITLIQDLEMGEIDSRLSEKVAKITTKLGAFTSRDFNAIEEASKLAYGAEEMNKKSSDPRHGRKRKRSKRKAVNGFDSRKYWCIRVNDDKSLLETRLLKLTREKKQREKAVVELRELKDRLENELDSKMIGDKKFSDFDNQIENLKRVLGKIDLKKKELLKFEKEEKEKKGRQSQQHQQLPLYSRGQQYHSDRMIQQQHNPSYASSSSTQKKRYPGQPSPYAPHPPNRYPGQPSPYAPKPPRKETQQSQRGRYGDDRQKFYQESQLRGGTGGYRHQQYASSFPPSFENSSHFPQAGVGVRNRNGNQFSHQNANSPVISAGRGRMATQPAWMSRKKGY
eukprot:g1699.t1